MHSGEGSRRAPQSTLEQQSSAADSEFVKLNDDFVEKIRSIPEGNKEFWVEPLTPQPEVRRSTKQMKALERYSPFLHYFLLTDSSEPGCYEEALQVEAKDKWELAMDDDMESFVKN